MGREDAKKVTEDLLVEISDYSVDCLLVGVAYD